MKFKQTTEVFKKVFLGYYGKDPGERLQPNSVVNLYVPPVVMGTCSSNVQVNTALLLGTHDSPHKLALTSHNHDLPRRRLGDHVVITKTTMHPQYRGLTYPYDFQHMDGVLKT